MSAATRHRSIGERMQRARALAVRVEIARDWAANWRRDHAATLAAARRSLAAGDADAAARRLEQLDALTDKGFRGLDAVIAGLSDEDVI